MTSPSENLRWRLYVRTRSWKSDYRWIGAEKPVEWWKSVPGGTLVTNTTGLLRNDNRLIITGIKGSRQDFAGTAISYDLVLVPDANGTLTSQDISNLITAFWESRDSSELGAKFDRSLGNEANALIEANSPEVTNSLIGSLKKLALDPATSRRMTGGVGAVTESARRMTGTSGRMTEILSSDVDLIYSKLLNSEVRDELMGKGISSYLVIDNGSDINIVEPAKIVPKQNTPIQPSGGGGCLIAIMAIASTTVMLCEVGLSLRSRST